MEQSETAGGRFTLKRASDYRDLLKGWWTRRWVRWLAYAVGAAILGWLLILAVFARGLPSPCSRSPMPAS